MKRIMQRFQLIRPLLGPLLFYIFFLAVSTSLVNLELDRSIKILITLLPMIPAGILAVGMVNAINKLDELERKIILEAAAASFLISFLGMIAISQLNRIGIPVPDPIYISLLMGVLVVIAKIAGNWKHR